MMIRDLKNVMVGVIFIALALVFGMSSLSLHLGSAGQMGAGYFPLMLAVALGLLGVVVVVLGFIKEGVRPDAANLRGILLVSMSVVVFAFGIKPLGLVPTVLFTSLLFSLAGRQFRPVSSLVAALVLALGSWVVFVIGLRMPWAPFGSLFS